MVKKITWNKKLIGICAGVALAIACLIPFAVQAADYPGVDQGSTVTGSTLSTDVGLKASEDQLKFSGPTRINFAVSGDGTFQCPSNAKFVNESIFNLKIASYTVTKDATTNPTPTTKALFDDASGSDVYYLNVNATPDGGLKSADVDFASTQTSAPTGFTIPYDAAGTAKNMTLGFEGKMKNMTAGKWTTGADLQKVVWTVSAA